MRIVNDSKGPILACGPLILSVVALRQLGLETLSGSGQLYVERFMQALSPAESLLL
jgi:hypothetical protein